ncbi:MAG: chondroitin lyase, partial [Bacteroidetes bacterium]|nr:chondroitin lyase [Bacteroidota bacterium]
QLADGMKLRCESPGIIILRFGQSGKVSLTVSDPNRELGKIHLSISKKMEGEGENFSAYWNEKEQLSEISIDLPKGNYQGSSVTVGF